MRVTQPVPQDASFPKTPWGNAEFLTSGPGREARDTESSRLLRSAGSRLSRQIACSESRQHLRFPIVWLSERHARQAVQPGSLAKAER